MKEQNLFEGRFELLAEIGRGRFGTVWLGRDLRSGAEVALKMAAEDSQSLRALENERAVLGALRSRGVPRLLDAGEGYLVLEVVAGTPLSELGGLHPGRLARIGAEAASVLDYIHGVGFVHGDITGDHVLVTREGGAVLIDFSLSHRPSETQKRGSGTPGTMAPELLQGGSCSVRTDLFSLGAVLYEALTGRPPFPGAETGESVEKLLRGGLPAPQALNPSVSPELSDAVMRALSANPEDRPGDAAALASALRSVPDWQGTGDFLAQLSRFVGRDGETDRALRTYFQSPRTFPTVLWIAGPRGVGKTRFLAELGRSLETFAPAVRSIDVPKGGPAGRGIALPMDHESQGPRNPVVLLDDLGDPQALLDALRSFPPGRGVFLAAVLAGDPPLPPPPEKTLFERIDLGLLSGEDLLRICESRLWKGAVSPEDLDLLVRASGGLPAVAMGVLDAAGEATAGGARPLALSLPLSATDPARRAFAARLLGQRQPAGALVRALAVLGEPAELDLLLRLGRIRKRQARSALEGLLEDGLIYARSPDGGTCFVLAGAAETIRQMLPPDLRAEMHAAASRLLRRSGAPAHRVAEHLLRSGDVGGGLRLLPDALPPGRIAAVVDALEEAERGAPAGSEQSAMLNATLGRLLTASDRKREALERFEKAAKAADLPPARRRDLRLASAEIRLADGDFEGACAVLSPSPADPGEEPRGLLLRGEALAGLARFAESREALGTALIRSPSPAQARMAHYLLGRVAHRLGEAEKAIASFRRALEAGGSDPVLEVRSLLGTGLARLALGDLGGAGSELLGAFERNARSRAGLDTELDLFLGLHAVFSGDAEKGFPRLLRALSASRKRGRTRRAEVFRALGASYAVSGRLRRAGRYLRGARDIFSRRKWTAEALTTSVLLAQVLLRRGDLGAAAELVPVFADRDEPLFAAAGAMIRAFQFLDEGNAQACLRMADSGGAALRGGVHSPEVSILLALARAKAGLRLGRFDDAWEDFRLLLADLEPYPGQVLEAAVAFAADVREVDAPADLVQKSARAVARAREAEPSSGDDVLRLKAEKALSELEARAATGPAGAGEDAHPPPPGAPPVAEDAARVDRRTERAERREKKLLILQSITRRINQEGDFERLLEMILDIALSVIGARRGFLLLAGADGGFEILARRRMDEGEAPRGDRVSFSIAREVLSTRSPVMTADALEDDRFRERVSVQNLALRSVLCVPLTGRTGPFGAVYAEDRDRPGIFTEEDLWFLSLFADQAAVALENARLRRENEKKRAELDRLNRRLAEKLESQARSIEVLETRISQAETGDAGRYPEIIGRSPAMQEVFRLLDRISSTEVPVLIVGRSGTGKELVARAVHRSGPRGKGPFAAENCAALTETLLESELFGHERGAFTGAVRARKGLFETAHKGTLFLDEVAEMSPGLQKKLLRVLQEGEIRRVGGKKTLPVDVRIISASNRDLEELVAAGRFREDLFYRLNVLRVDLPPLKDRREDIPLLARHFLSMAARQGEPRELTEGALARLSAYDWPGNVRELENEILRAAALGGTTLDVADLSPRLHATAADPADLDLHARVRALEVELIRTALESTGGNRSAAARLLGLSRYGLLKKMDRYGIE
jgi:transcriptional regulator with GAF, ATPase, and Fis domain/predicted Ser/Thr protein kinase